MAWTPRKKAIAFSTVLILVSVGFVASAAASTNGFLTPFRQGQDYPLERPLARNGVALALRVGSVASSGTPSPIESATVSVYRSSEADPEGGFLVGQKSTDAQGLALFQLPRGPYRVVVAWADDTTQERFLLRQSERVFVAFSDGGSAQWVRAPHRDLERRGEMTLLLIRALAANETGRKQPLSNVTIVARALKDREQPSDEPVATGQTGPRGLSALVLAQGAYRVEATWGNQTGVGEVRLGSPTHLEFVFGPTGVDVHAWSAGPGRPMDSHGPPRP